MTRSRLVVLASMAVVAVGVVAALGALWLDPARAAVGPMPAQALLFPADARYVMGFDVKRLTASPFYARYGAQKGMRPESLAQIEEKTGLDPARDIDTIVIAGAETGRGAVPGIALVTGRFDLYKLGRSLETEGKVRGYNHDGVTVYAYKEEGPRATAIAFLDDSSLLFGQKERVEAAVSSRTRGEAPLRGNAVLLALVEKVRPGSTFWMVGDQSLLAGMPSSIPAPGAAGGGEGGGATISLPALRTITVTGDLDPQVSLDLTGEAADEPAARNLADVVRGFVALMSLQAQQKPELQALASAFNVATEQNRVLVTARIPYAMIDSLSAKAKAGEAGKPAPVTK
jgi:hypothetical protein